MTPHSYIMIDGTFGWTAQSVYQFIHSFIHSFVRSFVLSFVRSFIHSFWRLIQRLFKTLLFRGAPSPVTAKEEGECYRNVGRYTACHVHTFALLYKRISTPVLSTARTCAGFASMELKSLFSLSPYSPLMSSVLPTIQSSRFSLLYNLSKRVLSPSLVRPYQAEEAYKSRTMVVALATEWSATAGRPSALSTQRAYTWTVSRPQLSTSLVVHQ